MSNQEPDRVIQSDYSTEAHISSVGLLLNVFVAIIRPHIITSNAVTGFDLERIEVTRGITAFNLGHNAVAGSLNTVIKRPRENRNSIWASAGEYATFGQGVSVSGKIGQSSGIRASFENEQSEGSGFDTGFHKKTCSLTAAHDFANGSFNSYLGCQARNSALSFLPGKGYRPGMATTFYPIQMR
jgi:outer membrane receptor protein involved in Fe transport